MEESLILVSNSNIYYSNIKILQDLRPKINFSFVEGNNNIKVTPIDDYSKYTNNEETLFRMVIGYNTSILMNSFSFFESCLEWCIIQDIDIKNIKNLHKDIVLDYIDKVIKFSSIREYKREFPLIKEKTIREYLENKTSDEFLRKRGKNVYKEFLFIENIYNLRHTIIHGSCLKYSDFPTDEHTKLLWLKDSDYIKLIQTIKSKIPIEIDDKYLKPQIFFLLNSVIDEIVNNIYIVCTEFYLFKGYHILK